MKKNKKRTSRCPACGEKIPIGEDLKVGQYLSCTICGELVELISFDPIVLDLIYRSGDNGHIADEYEYWESRWEKM